MAEPQRQELDELALFYEGVRQPDVTIWTVTIPYAHTDRVISIDGNGLSNVDYNLNEESREWADMSLQSSYWIYGPEFLPTDKFDWNEATQQREPRCSFIVIDYKDFIAAKLRWE